MKTTDYPRFGRNSFALAGGLVALLTILTPLPQALAEDGTNTTATVTTTNRAPDFVLKDTWGRVVKLADFAGKPLIVCFVVTWDEPSQKQIEILSDLVREHADKDLAVLCMSIERAGQSSTKDYVAREQPIIPFVVANYPTIQAFGAVRAVPTTFIIDKDHNVVQKHVGVTAKALLETALKLVPPK